MNAREHTDPGELMVVAFPSEDKAQEVLRVLQQLHREHLATLGNAAIIRRDAGGHVTIKETRDFDAKQGAVVGALAGGLIGALRGELLGGAALGLAGGLVANKVIDLGFPDAYLRDLAQQLAPGTSAIVAVVHFTQVDQAMAILDQFDGGTILRHTLAPEVAQQLSAVVED